MIVDTCAIAECCKTSPNAGFQHWLTQVTLAEVATTTISVTETWFGVQRLAAGHRRRALMTAVAELFATITVLGFDDNAAQMTAQLLVAQKQQGRAMKFTDAAIAGIALVHAQPLITRDSDFEGIDQLADFQSFQLVNPWN